MAKNPVFRDLRPVGQTPKHAFDKSRRDIYSCKPAMLNVCFVEDVIPDSEYDVQAVDIIRTDAIQSTPFARMTNNVEYHFVPYSQIWRDFERMFYERGDQQRNVVNSSSSVRTTKVPCFSYAFVAHSLIEQYCNLRLVLWARSYLQSLLDSHSDSSQIDVVVNVYDIYGNPHELIVSRDAVVDMLQQANQLRLGIIEIDTINFLYRDIHGRYCVDDMLRLFDMLGYGNLLPLAKQCFTKLFDYHAFSYDSQSIAGENAFIGELLYQNTGNLKLFFDRVVNWISGSSIFAGQTLYNWIYARFIEKVSVFRLAAYLKIWSDFYRNSQYDVDENYAYYFNFDWVNDSSDIGVISTKVIECLKPRYRQWKKDVFTGSYPTAQFGSVAVASLENPSIIINSAQTLDGFEAYTSNAYVERDGLRVDYDIDGSSAVSNTWNIDSSISALSIRQAMAMQRYKERILRAGNRVNALQRAVFGDSSRYIEDEYTKFINAFNQTIDFNAVATTAEGNERNVGELASNGVSTYGGNAFRYHSHDFGVIIGIQYILPEAEYEAYGLDMMVTKSISSDFFKPDFQNLGLAPVFNFNLDYLSRFYQVVGQPVNTVLGYLARYWEYKLSYDKVHGEFFNQPPFVTAFDSASALKLEPVLGAFANYVTPRKDNAVYNILNRFYVSPDSVDSIFYTASDELQSSDQFKINMNHEVRCVLPMSVVGLPTL